MHAVPGATPLEQLMSDAMTLAAAKGYDVFNALDLLEVRRWGVCVLGSITYRAGVVNPHGSCTFGRLWLVASPALVKLSLCWHNMARVHRPLAVAEILVLRHLSHTEPNVLGKPQVRHWRRLPALLPVQLADGQRTHTFRGRPHPDVKLPASPRASCFVFNSVSPL